jgi:hypothetical protein
LRAIHHDNRDNHVVADGRSTVACGLSTELQPKISIEKIDQGCASLLGSPRPDYASQHRELVRITHRTRFPIDQVDSRVAY